MTDSTVPKGHNPFELDASKAPHWSSDIPTRPGFYWHRRPEDRAPALWKVSIVVHLDGDWYFHANDVGFESATMIKNGGQFWSERLESPHDVL